MRLALLNRLRGMSATLCEADADLRRDKAEREALGDRAARGERPKWDQPK